MRNNWNFSHTVTPTSESFGIHDTATTGSSFVDATRAANVRNAWLRRMALMIDADTGKAIGFGGALALWEDEFGGK
jgi:hypothetical protein